MRALSRGDSLGLLTAVPYLRVGSSPFSRMVASGNPRKGCLETCYEDGMSFDRLLDASIFFSFDRTGYLRHARAFSTEDEATDLSGRVVVVTGANSGIGLATAEALGRKGAHVILACRSETRGREALERLRREDPKVHARLEILDVSSLASIRAFADRLQETKIDVLVHNAGVLPDQRTMTADGFELTWATHVLGPFALTRQLLPRLRASDSARIITVTSGGMYLRRLDLGDLEWTRRAYDGVLAYADTKRAQVVLNALWAEQFAERGLFFAAMHPGWADTPAVRSSLPRFHKLMHGRLRSAAEGADTVIWLASTRMFPGASGSLWFDRRPVRSHLLPWTVERESTRRALWALLEHQTSSAPSAGRSR